MNARLLQIRFERLHAGIDVSEARALGLQVALQRSPGLAQQPRDAVEVVRGPLRSENENLADRLSRRARARLATMRLRSESVTEAASGGPRDTRAGSFGRRG